MAFEPDRSSIRLNVWPAPQRPRNPRYGSSAAVESLHPATPGVSRRTAPRGHREAPPGRHRRDITVQIGAQHPRARPGRAGRAAPGWDGRSRCRRRPRPAPRRMRPRRGRLSWYADPWCATLSTSARTGPAPSRPQQLLLLLGLGVAGQQHGPPAPAAPASPASCCSDPTVVPCSAATGPTPELAAPPATIAPARPDRSTGTPRRRGRRATAARRRPVPASPAVTTASTRRSRNTPATPPTWSAWKWRQHEQRHLPDPSRRRQPSTAVGLRPASTTTRARPARPAAPAASPWPTSQATSTQPGGGQPGAEQPHRQRAHHGRDARRPRPAARRSTAAARPRPAPP